MSVDVECYEAAIQEVLGIEIPADWPMLEDVTDPAILVTALDRLGRPHPDEATLNRVAEAVGERLERELARDPSRFQAIPGATGVFDLLRKAGWTVAMATGAWRPSAVVKLRGAGIPHEDVPLATASDHPNRAQIIQHAVGFSAAEVGDSIVYVGDGVWDGRAAGSLGYGFLGVAPPHRVPDLVAAGAGGVVADFTDTGSFLQEMTRIAS